MEEAGWRLRIEHADGADALVAALQRRGWGAVLYGGDGPNAVPARKALALVRLADPHLPFLAVSPFVHAGDLKAIVRGLDGDVAVVPDPAQLPRALTRALDATRLRRRVGGAHRFLLAQQAITDHVAAGLEPRELVARVLATLGETLGWSCGAVWRPSADGSELHCAATWHRGQRRRRTSWPCRRPRARGCWRPGRACPGACGRSGARRGSTTRARAANDPRAAMARRAGLMTAAAFPIAIADRCAGVIEFYSQGVTEPNPEVVGDVRHRRRPARAVPRAPVDAGRRRRAPLDGRRRVPAAGARRRRPRAAGQPQRVRARRALRGELIGSDWVDVAVPELERDGVRRSPAARAEHAVDGDRLVKWQLAPLSEGDGVVGTWATGAVREAPAADSVEARLRRALGVRRAAAALPADLRPATGALVALEALLRWKDPVHGMISPADFIPVAEQTGLIDALGDWVLAAVCAQQVVGRPGPAPAHLLQRVADAAAARGLPRPRARPARRERAPTPARLTVELTESSTLEDPALAEALVRDLHGLGLRIALDDFGTGYSSLSRLRELPVSTLKIDRAFMREVPGAAGGGRGRHARSSSSPARSAAPPSPRAWRPRRSARSSMREGCPLAQGFLLGAPAPPEALEELMRGPLLGPLRALS